MNNCLNCLTTLLLLCWSLVAANAKTDEMRTVTVNGATRAYWLYVPDKVTAPAPLVLSLHGTGGHAADKSPFRTTVADQEGCIVAYLHQRLSYQRVPSSSDKCPSSTFLAYTWQG